MADDNFLDFYKQNSKPLEALDEETPVVEGVEPASQQEPDPFLDFYKKAKTDTPSRSLWKNVTDYTDASLSTAFNNTSVAMSTLLLEDEFAKIDSLKGEYGYGDFAYDLAKTFLPGSLGLSSVNRSQAFKKFTQSKKVSHEDSYKNNLEYKAQVDEYEKAVMGTFDKNVTAKQKRLQAKFNEKGYNDLSDGVIGGMSSAMTYVPAAIALYATRSPAVLESYIGLMGIQSKGMAFSDAINRGADYTQAMSNSNWSGAIESALGRVGFGPNSQFMKQFISKNDGSFKKMMKQAPINVLTEMGAESATTLLQETSTLLHDIQSDLRIALDNQDNPQYDGPGAGELVMDYLQTTVIAAGVGAGGTLGVTGGVKYTGDSLGKLAKAGIKKGSDYIDAHTKVLSNVEKSQRPLNKLTMDASNNDSFEDFINQDEFIEKIANDIVSLEIDAYDRETKPDRVKFPIMDRPVKARDVLNRMISKDFYRLSELSYALGINPKNMPKNYWSKTGAKDFDELEIHFEEQGFLTPDTISGLNPNKPRDDKTEEVMKLIADNPSNIETIEKRGGFENQYDIAMYTFLKGQKDSLDKKKIANQNKLKELDIEESLNRLEERGEVVQDESGWRIVDNRDSDIVPLDVETTEFTQKDMESIPVDEFVQDQQADQQQEIESGSVVPVIVAPKRIKKNKVADDPDPKDSFEYNDISGMMNFFEGISMKYADKYSHWRKLEKDLLNEIGFDGVEQYLTNAGIDPSKRDWRVGVQSDIYQGPVVETSNVIQQEIIPKLVKHLEENDIDLESFDHFLYNLHATERNNFIKDSNEQELKTLNILSESGKATSKQKQRIEVLKERIESGKGSGISTEDAQDTLREYGVEIMDDGTAVAKGEKGKNFLTGYEDFVTTLLDMKRDAYRESGLVDENQIDDWNDRYKYYVPLKGFAENTLEVDGVSMQKKESTNGLINKSLGTPKTIERAAKGRDSVAASPLTQTLSDVMASKIYAQKNRVHKAAGDMALAFPNSKLWDVKPDNTGKTWGFDANPRLPNTSQISFKSNGKSYSLLLKSKKLSVGLEHMDNSVNEMLYKASRPLVSYLSYMNTSVDPEFVVNNFMRDVQTGYYNLLTERDMKGGRFEGVSTLAREDVAKNFNAKSLFKNMKSYFVYERNRNSKNPMDRESYEYKLIKAFKESGSQTGFLDQKTLEQRQEHMKRLMDMYQGDLKASALRAKDIALDFIEDTNFAVENASRITAFEAYVNAKGGLDKVSQADLDRAAALGKNLTVNFNRGGTSTGKIGSMYLFFNASVQGTMNVFRGMGTKQKQDIFKGIYALGAATTMTNIMSSGEDKEGLYYEKISDFDKMTGIIMMLPNVSQIDGEFVIEKYGISGRGKRYFMIDNNGKKRPVAIKIPLPYGYAFFHNLGRITTEIAMAKGMDNYDRDIGEASLELGQSLISNYSPLGFDNSDNVFKNITKTLTPDSVFKIPAKQITELLVNEDFFGAPIYFQNFPGQNKPSSWHEKNKTVDYLEDFTKFINEETGGTDYAPGKVDIDPSIIQYGFDYMLGGLGRTGRRFIQMATDDKIPLEQKPFVRRLMVTTRDVEDSSKFFDNYTNLISIQSRYNDGKDSKIRDNDDWLEGSDPWAKDLINTKSERLTRARGNKSALNNAIKKVKSFKEQEDKIRNDYYRSDNDKFRELLTKLNLERNDFYQEFNRLVEEAKKQD